MKTEKLFWNSFYTKLMAFSHILGRGTGLLELVRGGKWNETG